MASVVPGFEHDVFVSYATVDDRPARSGWVTAFVETLRESLSAMFGRRDPDRIWWDRSNIDEEASLTNQIRTKVEKSACMVVILSRGYAASKWCAEERTAFLRAIQHQQSDARIFLVDIGNLPEADRPAEFRDIRGRHFWVQSMGTESGEDRQTLGAPVPDPTNREHARFYAAVDDLAKSVHKRVSQLAAKGKESPVGEKPATVFVAEASDTAQDSRDEVAKFLSDHFSVVPALDRALPGDWIGWRTAVEAAIAEASVFVQILDASPGRRIIGSDQQRLVIAQYDIARSAGKKILQWRPAELVPESAGDVRLRELLAAAEYRGELESFKMEVKRIAAPPPPAKQSPRGIPLGGEIPMVFINAGPEDRQFAQELSDKLGGLNCFSPLPLDVGDPKDLREDLESNIMECDGLILYYGKITPQWVRQQLMSLRRILPKRDRLDPPRPLKAIAICTGPPVEKPDVALSWPGLQWLDGTQGLSGDQLLSWLEKLQTGGLA